MGVGASEKPREVRWGVGGEMALAWLLTLPGAGILSCLIYLLIKYCTGLTG